MRAPVASLTGICVKRAITQQPGINHQLPICPHDRHGVRLGACCKGIGADGQRHRYEQVEAAFAVVTSPQRKMIWATEKRKRPPIRIRMWNPIQFRRW